MTNILTKTLRSSFLILAFSLFVNNASAQNCATPPTCESLGYNLSSAVSNNCIKCPLGNKYFCSPPASCSDMGYTMTSCDDTKLKIMNSPTKYANCQKCPFGNFYKIECNVNYAEEYNEHWLKKCTIPVYNVTDRKPEGGIFTIGECEFYIEKGFLDPSNFPYNHCLIDVEVDVCKRLCAGN